MTKTQTNNNIYKIRTTPAVHEGRGHCGATSSFVPIWKLASPRPAPTIATSFVTRVESENSKFFPLNSESYGYSPPTSNNVLLASLVQPSYVINSVWLLFYFLRGHSIVNSSVN